MTIPEILAELTPYTRKFPRKAMQEAIAQREAITPELLRVLGEVAQDGAVFAAREGYMLHMYAAYLLAQFRETRAFQPLVRMASLAGKVADDLFGDTIAEGLDRILATVFDGNLAALQALIENPEADQFARSSAVRALLVLERSNQISREEVIAYFQRLFTGQLEREYSYVWSGLASACAKLPAPELLEEIRRADQEGLLEHGYLDSIEKEIGIPLQKRDPRRQPDFSLITDAISEMEWWAAFDDKNAPASQPPASTEQVVSHTSSPASIAPASPPETSLATRFQPVRRDGPKIGRNDPCPCGSGKKYKKCCLGNR